MSPVNPAQPRVFTKEDAQHQLQALMGSFPREEARRMKARAFWAARKCRKATRRDKDASAEAAADEPVCPITLTPRSQLQHPCVASDGCIYESAALEQWARANPTSPISRIPLRFGVPLQAARRAVAQ